jgi:hypothetical protein
MYFIVLSELLSVLIDSDVLVVLLVTQPSTSLLVVFLFTYHNFE